LQDLGNKIVAVVTLSDCLDHDDSDYSFPVIRLCRGSFKPIRWWKTVGKIIELSRNANVVYLNGLVLEGIIAAKIIARRPTVIKVVGDLIWEKARNSGKYQLDLDQFQNAKLPVTWDFMRRLQRWYTSLADAVITPSRYLSGIVEGWGVKASKIHTIYNAVPASSYPQDAEKKYDLITVSRLVPWKGIPELIQISAELGLSLRIVGCGPMRKKFEKIAINSGANASFTGHISQKQVSEEISKGRLFILNSRYEGLPHIILEAKASGIAVLASNAGGTPETIEHGVDGWIVPVGDKKALKGAIILLLKDETLRQEIAQKGQRQVLEKFNPKRQIQDTLSVLKMVETSSNVL
jgi:glycosyltransferase involved in cell wall biosynthesis